METIVPSQSSESQTILLVPAQEWRRIVLVSLPLSVVYAGLLFVESFAIARIDVLLQIESFELAAWYSVYIAAASQWLRLCIIGVGVYLASNALRADDGFRLPKKFLSFWTVISLGFALSLMAVDLVLNALQFTDDPMSNLSMRWVWLGLIYVRIILLYIAARFMIGALSLGHDASSGWRAAWSATTLLQSMGLVLVLLVLKLVIDDVLVNVVSYIPVVSPFWFIPDELSPLRGIVGQGAWIVAAAIGVFFYVAFFVAAGRRISPPQAPNS